MRIDFTKTKSTDSDNPEPHRHRCHARMGRLAFNDRKQQAAGGLGRRSGEFPYLLNYTLPARYAQVLTPKKSQRRSLAAWFPATGYSYIKPPRTLIQTPPPPITSTFTTHKPRFTPSAKPPSTSCGRYAYPPYVVGPERPKPTAAHTRLYYATLYGEGGGVAKYKTSQERRKHGGGEQPKSRMNDLGWDKGKGQIYGNKRTC